MAFIAARMSILRGRPPGRADGISGSSCAHSVSRRSLGFVRCDDDLAFIDFGRRLAAEGDSVIANRCALVESPIGDGAMPTVTPLTLSSQTKATLFGIM
jgi:hypothetical protein